MGINSADLLNFNKNLCKMPFLGYRRIPMEVNGVKLSSIGGVDPVDCGRCGVVECGNQDDGVENFPVDHLGPWGTRGLSSLFPGEMAASLVKKKGPTRKATHTVPHGIFSRSPAEGAPLLQAYLDKLPEKERYSVFASLVQIQWKWLCKAVPYLKFPKPTPIREGEVINIGLRNWALPAGGGIGRSMQQLANHLAKDQRYHVTVFIDKKQINRVGYSLHKNVTLAPVVSRKNSYINWSEYTEKYPVDLLICPEHYTISNIKNILLLKFLGLRVIAQERNFVFDPSPFHNTQNKIEHLSPLYSGCNMLTCPSSVDLHQWRKLGVKNSVVIHNSPTFNPSAFAPALQQTKNVLWVGRWNPGQKRPIMAVETFAKVLEKVPDARLIMLGYYDPKSACYEECKQFIEKHGIGHAVEIHGSQKDMASHYANGALLCSTSRHEGFGNVFAEAKAFGLPVVAMELPYVEILKKGCIQTPKNDVDALADAVVDLLENPEKRKNLGEEGRQDIMEKFSSEIVFAKYEALIQAILKGSDAVKELCAQQALLDAETAESILAEEAKVWE